jgi:hypothetical protein
MYLHSVSLTGIKWCPETLLDIAQLEKYYKQISMEEALTTDGWGFRTLSILTP